MIYDAINPQCRFPTSFAATTCAQEKARALDEATAAIDELEAKAERLGRQLEAEKRAHTGTKLERDEIAATLEVRESTEDAREKEGRKKGCAPAGTTVDVAPLFLLAPLLHPPTRDTHTHTH